MNPLRTLYAGLLWAGNAFVGLVFRAGEEPEPANPGRLCGRPGTSPALDGTPAVSARLTGTPGVQEC